MKEKKIIQDNIEYVQIEEFIKKELENAKYGKIELQHTPVGNRIIIHTSTPGLVIGRSGSNINQLIEKIKNSFSLENLQIDVQKVDNPDMDPIIVAENIAIALEKGIHYKRLGNQYAERIMGAGAVGCEILFSGKFAGARGRKARFIRGYLKKSGTKSKENVTTGFAVGSPPLGSVGITVKIMEKKPPSVINKTKIKEIKGEKNETQKNT